jgi:quercetin dioxygenase-like cupin family protein
MSSQTEQVLVRWGDVTPVEMIPGLFRRTLGETSREQVVEVRAQAGVKLPEHSHPHDQVGYVVSGQIEITIGGVSHLCNPGDSWAIPGNVDHSAFFPVDTVVIDCFSPPREEYR